VWSVTDSNEVAAAHRAIAQDTSQTLSETIVALMRRGLARGSTAQVSRSSRTGLPVVRLGTVITSDDVRALDNDQPDPTTAADNPAGQATVPG
jgi:hypothetical protein